MFQYNESFGGVQGNSNSEYEKMMKSLEDKQNLRAQERNEMLNRMARLSGAAFKAEVANFEVQEGAEQITKIYDNSTLIARNIVSDARANHVFNKTTNDYKDLNTLLRQNGLSEIVATTMTGYGEINNAMSAAAINMGYDHFDYGSATMTAVKGYVTGVYKDGNTTKVNLQDIAINNTGNNSINYAEKFFNGDTYFKETVDKIIHPEIQSIANKMGYARFDYGDINTAMKKGYVEAVGYDGKTSRVYLKDFTSEFRFETKEDLKAFLNTDKVRNQINMAAKKMGYDAFSGDLLKGYDTGKIQVIKNGKTSTINLRKEKIKDNNFNFNTAFDTQITGDKYFQSIIDNRKITEDNAIKNGNKVEELIRRSPDLSKLGLNQMNSRQITNLLNQANKGIGKFSKLSEEDKRLVKSIRDVKSQKEIAEVSKKMSNKTSNNYKNVVKKQVDGYEVTEGYNDLKQNYNNIKRLVTAPTRMHTAAIEKTKMHREKSMYKVQNRADKLYGKRTKAEAKIEKKRTTGQNTRALERKEKRLEFKANKKNAKYEKRRNKFDTKYGKNSKYAKIQRKKELKRQNSLRERKKRFTNKLFAPIRELKANVKNKILGLFKNIFKYIIKLLEMIGSVILSVIQALLTLLLSLLPILIPALIPIIVVALFVGAVPALISGLSSTVFSSMSGASSVNSSRVCIYDTIKSERNWYNDAQIAGIMGNFYYESEMNPMYRANGEVGLFGWDEDSYDSIVNYCSSRGWSNPFELSDTELEAAEDDDNDSLNISSDTITPLIQSQVKYFLSHNAQYPYSEDYSDSNEGARSAASKIYYANINSYDDGSLSARQSKAEEMYQWIAAKNLDNMIDDSESQAPGKETIMQGLILLQKTFSASNGDGSYVNGADVCAGDNDEYWDMCFAKYCLEQGDSGLSDLPTNILDLERRAINDNAYWGVEGLAKDDLKQGYIVILEMEDGSKKAGLLVAHSDESIFVLQGDISGSDYYPDYHKNGDGTWEIYKTVNENSVHLFKYALNGDDGFTGVYAWY